MVSVVYVPVPLLYYLMGIGIVTDTIDAVRNYLIR